MIFRSNKLWLLALPLLLVACNKGQAGGAGGTTKQEETYTLTVVPPGAGAGGAELAARVRVVPRGGYKVNLEYPTKLSLKGSAGAAPAAPVITAKQAARMTKSELLMTPAVKASQAGTHAVTAELKFSVCTDQVCEFKSVPLSWSVTAK